MVKSKLFRQLSICTLGLLLTSLASASDAQTVLLDFSSPHCGPCQQLKPTIHRLQSEGFPVRVVDTTREGQLAHQFNVKRVPCLVMLVDGREVSRMQGAQSYDRLRQVFRSAKVQPVAQAKPAERAPARPRIVETDAPSWSNGPNPQPSLASHENIPAGLASPPAVANVNPQNFEQRLLRASVRIRVEDAKGHSFGTGTVIDTMANPTTGKKEALVITCGHLFRGDAQNGKITIELFEPTAGGVRVLDRVPGYLETFDDKLDVGFVSFQPRTPVEVAKVAAEPTEQVNSRVWSVGCDRGADPTVRGSRVTAINRYNGPPNIESAGAPVEGRSGGGLFNERGELVGICNCADTELDEGIYASLTSIHSELERIGLTRIFRPASQPNEQVASHPRRQSQLPDLRSGEPIVRLQSPSEPEEPAARQFPAAPAALERVASLPEGERAALEEIASRAADAEVVCVIRALEPGGKSEVIKLDRVSPEFIEALRAAAASKE